MSSSKRQNNDRFVPQRETTKTKEVPHAGLVMLKADGSNQVVWTAALNSHIEATWGTYGTAITKGAVIVRELPTADLISDEFPGLSPANVQKQLMDDVSQYRKQTRKDAESRNSIFALMRQVISEEGMSRVENLAGYIAVEVSRDPCALFALIRSEHSLRTNNMSEREAKHVAEKRYWRLRQGLKQSDAEFADEFRLCVSNMKTLACTSDPTAEEQAIHFLTCLQPKVHGEYMRDTVNRERATAGAIPVTVAGVMDAARMFIPTPSRSAQGGEGKQTMVYAGLNEAQKKKPCANCGELGHWAKECDKPDSRTGDGIKEATVKKKGKKHVFQAETNVVVGTGDVSSDEDEDTLGYGFTARIYAVRMSKAQRNDTFTIDSFADESFVMCEKHLDDGIDELTSVKGIHGVENLRRRGILPGIGPCIVSLKAE